MSTTRSAAVTRSSFGSNQPGAAAASHTPPAVATACCHTTPCPGAEAPDRGRARILVAHPEQGWSLLCNGVIEFEDLGELLPEPAGLS